MFIFQLKQKDRSNILSAFHILIALILLFDFRHAPKETVKDWVFSSVCLVALIFLLIVGIASKKMITASSKHLSLLLFESILLTCAAIYFWSKGNSFVAATHVILAGAIILFWIYLKKREEGEKIIVSEDNIILPGLFGDRVISWTELTNVIKKHDLLTIDFNNNKIIQVEVRDSDKDTGEDEFNQFCRQRLATQNN